MAKRKPRQRATESGHVASRKDLIRYIGTLEGALHAAQLRAAVAYARIEELEGGHANEGIEAPPDMADWVASVAGEEVGDPLEGVEPVGDQVE